jgi:insertion element IS1 protein InsB
MDEQWSFVGSKKRQHWLFYALDTKRRKVLAHTFGPRNSETLLSLVRLLKKFSIRFITTDQWIPYQKFTPQHLYLMGKIFTQRIERFNLTLRTHIK